MKVIAKNNVNFKPFTVAITLETQEEVNSLHNIFNTPVILDATDRVIEGYEIRDALEPYVRGDADWETYHRRFKDAAKERYTF
jgi:hypothetical protein